MSVRGYWEIVEILVDDIPPEGLDVDATEEDEWLASLLVDALGAAFGKGMHASISLSLHRVEGNIDVEGEVRFTIHAPCDRCLAEFEREESVAIRAVFAPMYESERQRQLEEEIDIEPVADDVDFSFYEGDRIDLGELVREQVLLAVPMKRLCREDCMGLCPRCGKDLNEGPCGCVEDHTDPRWAKLKDFKPRRD